MKLKYRLRSGWQWPPFIRSVSYVSPCMHSIVLVIIYISAHTGNLTIAISHPITRPDMASWDLLFGVLPEELPKPVRYFVVGMLVRLYNPRTICCRGVATSRSDGPPHTL